MMLEIKIDQWELQKMLRAYINEKTGGTLDYDDTMAISLKCDSAVHKKQLKTKVKHQFIDGEISAAVNSESYLKVFVNKGGN